MLQIVVDAQQLLGTGGGWIRQQAGLIAPDDGLHPGVHGPGIIAAPHLIYAQGVSLVGKHASGMGVVVCHHGLYSGVSDGFGIAPGLPLQGPAHAFPVLGAEADGAFLVVIEGHLMEPAGPQAGRLIVDAVVGAVLHLDGAGGVRCQCGGGQQAQHTGQHQHHGDHSLVWETNLSHTLFLSEKGKAGGPCFPTIKTGCGDLVPTACFFFCVLIY